VTFESLAKALLLFFQLPVHHDTVLELLSKFKQTTAIHRSDHIHEWHRCCSLCKEETTKEQHLDWFLKSLVFVVSKEVASTFPQSEEEAINNAKQFNLIYAHSGYLYIVFPDASKIIPFGQDKPRMSHTRDGLIGSMNHIKPYGHPPPAYGAHQYPQPYGGMSYYPPLTHQPSYHVVHPPPMGRNSPVPMMRLASQLSMVPPSTSTYNLSTSENDSTSYTPYGSSPQNNTYFYFPSPPQLVAPPSGYPYADINFVKPSPIHQLQTFEKMNTENLSHLPNNAKKKGKN
jgi:hypothetical protein